MSSFVRSNFHSFYLPASLNRDLTHLCPLCFLSSCIVFSFSACSSPPDLLFSPFFVISSVLPCLSHAVFLFILLYTCSTLNIPALDFLVLSLAQRLTQTPIVCPRTHTQPTRLQEREIMLCLLGWTHAWGFDRREWKLSPVCSRACVDYCL